MRKPERLHILKRLSIAAALVVVVLIALPYGVKYGAIYGLKKAGATEVVLDDIDLNLFTGVLAIKGLVVGEKKAPDLLLSYLQLEVAYLPLFEKRFLLEAVQLEKVHLNIHEQQGQLHIVVPIPVSESDVDGEDDVASNDGSGPWGIGLSNMVLADVALNVNAKGVKSEVQVKRLNISGLHSWMPGDMSALSLEGEINGAPLKVNGNVQPFDDIPEYKTHIKIDALSLSPLAPFLKDYMQSYNANVSLDTDLRIVMMKEGGIEISQQGALDVEVGSLVREDAALKDSHIGWEGEVRLELPVDADPLVKADGKLFSRQLSIDFPEIALGIKHQGLKWQGAASIDAGDVEHSMQATGGVTLSELKVVDLKEAINPLTLQHLFLEEVSVAGMETIALGRLNVQELTLLSARSTSKLTSKPSFKIPPDPKSNPEISSMPPVPPVLSLNDIVVHSVQLKQKSDIEIESVVVNGLATSISVLENGELDVIDAYLESINSRLNANSPEEEGKEPSSDISSSSEENSAESKKTVIHFALGEFRVEGDNNILFSDYTVTPRYTENLHIDKVVVGAISSKQKKTLTPVDVALRIGEFSTVALKGALTPLQKKVAGTLDLVVKGVELTKVSPYAEKAIGYAIGSGQFNLDTAVILANGQMKVSNDVLLKQLVLTPVNEELIASVSKQFSMPIGISLGLLKDSDGDIRLSVPLEGDLNDPSVNVAYVVRLALVQAIKKGSLSYLKYAIQPYGAILLVGEAVGEMVMKVTVAPLGFVAGSSDLVEEDLENVPKLSVLLNSLPEKSVTLCPIITRLDAPSEKNELAINDKLKALALSRLAMIKAGLVSDHGIAPERILFCRAKVGEGQPRVELEI